MGTEESFGKLFGKAKKWAQQELKSVKPTFGGTPNERRAEREAHEDLGRSIEYDAERLQQEVLIDALTPQSLKDYQAQNAANKAERATQRDAEQRAERAARAGDSRVEFTGCFVGVAEGLAVEVNQYDDPEQPDPNVYVNVECVDPVPMQGCTLSGFNFAIPNFHGDGTYNLVGDDIDALQYEVFITDENSEGWAFHPSHGPGVITVSEGVANLDLTIGGAGSETARLRATITL